MDIISTISHKEATIQSYMRQPDFPAYSLNESVDMGDLDDIRDLWPEMLEAANRLQKQLQNQTTPSEDTEVLSESRIIEWLRRPEFAFDMMNDAINDGNIEEIRILWRRVKKVIARLHAEELKCLEDAEDSLEPIPA